jgi:hypothetical protein
MGRYSAATAAAGGRPVFLNPIDLHFPRQKHPRVNLTTTSNTEDLQRNALCGVQYLLNQIREDGSFVYEQNASTGMIAMTSNILRHAGCLYVLYQYQNEGLVSTQGADELLDRATAYLLRQIKPVKDQPECAAVLEMNTVKLGGSALALIALIERYKYQPEADKLALMKSLALFIVVMQEPSGKFHSKSDSRTAAYGSFESAYYPGQAILALTNLYEIDADPHWLQAATAGARYLVQHPVWEQGQKVNNHWFAIAISRLYFITHNLHLYEELCSIATICIGEIDRRLPNPPGPHDDNASAWATFGESLVAAMQVERKIGRPKRADLLLPYATRLVEACLQLQIQYTDPQYKCYTVGAIRENAKSSRVRIDYVQHVLSVILGLVAKEKRHLTHL